MPAVVLDRIAELLPDIQTLINWKLTCKTLKNAVDKKKDASKFASKEISVLVIRAEKEDAVKFHYFDKNDKNDLRNKDRYWHPNDPDKLPLNVLMKHWKIKGVVLKSGTFIMEPVVDFLMNSQLDRRSSDRYLAFCLGIEISFRTLFEGFFS